jgi:hypothetical protein
LFRIPKLSEARRWTGGVEIELAGTGKNVPARTENERLFVAALDSVQTVRSPIAGLRNSPTRGKPNRNIRGLLPVREFCEQTESCLPVWIGEIPKENARPFAVVELRWPERRVE